MPIISVTPGQVGLVGVLPSIAYIQTTDTVATVTSTGYLNKEVASGVQFSLPCIAAVTTQTSPSATPQVGWYEVQHVGSNWSLDAGSNTALSLTNTHIFVGNSGNVAADVPLSGDATLANTGVLTIANGAITNAKVSATAAIAFSKLATLATGHILAGNAGVVTDVTLGGDATIGATGTLTIASSAITTSKIAAANITLALLSAGITPAAVIKFASQYTTVGGAAAEAITVTGAVAATDRAFVQLVAPGSNTVSVVQAVVTTNTLTVTFSGNPGSDAIINYQIIRAAS